MNVLDLHFGTPEHGWMKIELCSQAAEIVLDVSDIPCDSLRSLVEALLKLAEGSGEEIVQWSLEPEYADLIFKRIDNDIELAVSIPSGKPPRRICVCDAKKLFHRFYRGLRDLEANPVWRNSDLPESIWSWDFPSRLLSDLGLVMKKTNGAA